MQEKLSSKSQSERIVGNMLVLHMTDSGPTLGTSTVVSPLQKWYLIIQSGICPENH